RTRHAEAGDAQGRQGQPQARRHGARDLDAALRAAGEARRMGRGLPHGRARSRAVTPPLPPDRAEAFIRANTALIAPPHVPEIRVRKADEARDVWQLTEDVLEASGVQPPFWAFAWAGGQGLARYVLDNAGLVRGRKVLDFATGSGLVAIAAAKAG